MTQVTASCEDLTTNGASTIAFVAADAGTAEFAIDVDSLPGGIDDELILRIGFLATFTSRWIENTFGCVNALFKTGQIEAGRRGSGNES